jgi:ATP-dependent RNA helicase DDX55/SPB4
MAGTRFSVFPGLSEESRSVLAAQGFTRATPVQEATIPLFSGHKDVAVDACTGSGKTLAFVLPVVEKMRRLEEPLKRHQVGPAAGTAAAAAAAAAEPASVPCDFRGC